MIVPHQYDLHHVQESNAYNHSHLNPTGVDLLSRNKIFNIQWIIKK